MTLHVEIINPYPATTVKELLETKLLIPRKIRHFLRTKKHVLINGETINWQSPVKEGDRISLTFDTEDYPNILPILNRLLEDKMIQRQYWALTEGKFQTKKTVYKDKIGRDRHDRRKRVVDPRKGQSAYTTVTRLKTFEGASLVNCQLKTGRTHQIRVHLSHHGHAILGDPLYSHQPASRLMLHAHSLSFTHPLTLEKVTVKVKSESFEQVLRNHKS